MAQKDPKIEAVETVYTAMKSLNQQERQEIIASVFALLGSVPPPAQGGSTATSTTGGQSPPGTTTAPRQKGLTEIMQERSAGTNAQRIVLFAYYREKHENAPRFARDDLKGYFGKAHLPAPKNFDRDFNTAVQRGWLCEDKAESYITTKGIEAVEAGFEGERSYSRHTKGAKKAKGAKKTKSAKLQQKRKTTSKAQ
jgi:hypothetical protein